MPVPDFAHGIQISFLDSATRAHQKAKPAATASATPASSSGPAKPTAEASNDDGLSFDDLLDVVNPLQHIPVVSTLYRHYAHDDIKPLPKIAGDALYGGVPGLVSSVADFAFEKITGKNFGDTVLSWVTGDDDKATALASKTPATTAAKPAVVADATSAAKPATTPPASTPSSDTKQTTAAPLPLANTASGNSIPTLSQSQLDALMASINQKGIDPDLSSRAMDAYRKMNTQGTAPAPVAPLQLH
jgi:hypothetical protein